LPHWRSGARSLQLKAGRAEWTREDERDLRLMLAEGRTSGCIAKRLGRSRNSVCGKIHRMGGRRAYA
jgi:hypothetical protein